MARFHLFSLLGCLFLAQTAAAEEPHKALAPPSGSAGIASSGAGSTENGNPAGNGFWSFLVREPKPEGVRQAEPQPQPSEPSDRFMFLQRLWPWATASHDTPKTSRSDNDSSAKPEPQGTASSGRGAPNGGSDSVESKAGLGKRTPPSPPDYFVVRRDTADFYLTDFRVARETKEVSLSNGTVARSHGEGEKWAWVELNSGAVGLMRKKSLDAATGSQIKEFLASEAALAVSADSMPQENAANVEEGAVEIKNPVSLPWQRVSAAGPVSATPRIDPANDLAPPAPKLENPASE